MLGNHVMRTYKILQAAFSRHEHPELLRCFTALLGLVEEFFTPHCPIPLHDHSHETANGNHNSTMKKLQGICQVDDWELATAQGPKSMFR
jgi:hypothetical protein